MRRIVPSVLGLCLAGGPAMACAEGEVPIFSCTTDDEDNHYVAVCGVGEPQGDVFPGVRYVYGSRAGEELSYPPDPADAKTLLFFSHWFEKGRYRAVLRFATGGYSYRVSYIVTSDEIDPMGGYPMDLDSGVEVRRKGKLVARKDCHERPRLYGDLLAKSVACDAENPHGRSACAATAPEFK